MSFQPPPPPAGPPGYGPLGPGGGLTAGSGGPPAKQRSPLPWIIGGVVALVAIVVVVVLLLTRGGGSSVDAEGAAGGMSALIDDADFDETGASDLRDCPFGDEVDLTEQIADRIDASDDLLDGDATAAVFDRTDTSPEYVLCELSVLDDVDGPYSVNYLANPLPRGDYADFIEESFGEGADVDVDDPVDGEGGVFYSYCGQAEGNDEACGTDWVDEDEELVIGFYVVGDRLDADDSRAALEDILETMADGLAAEA